MAKRVGANAELNKAKKSDKIASFKMGRWIAIVLVSVIALKFGIDALRKIDISSKLMPLITVESVEVNGVFQLDSLAIIDAAGVDSGTTLLSSDREEICLRIEEFPGVLSVDMGFPFSKTLKITVLERQAIALVVLDGNLFFMSRDGVLWPFTSGDYWDVPVLTGAHDTITDGGLRKVTERDLSRFTGIMHSFTEDRDHFPVAVNLENQDRISLRLTGFEPTVRFSNDTRNRIQNMRAIMDRLRREDVEVYHYIDLSYKNVAFFQ